MKKHIFGLVLFSFIVSAAAIVYAVFNVPKIIPIAVPQYVSTERKHCKFKRKIKQSDDNAPIVTQAVYSVKTRKLSWKYDSSNINSITFLQFWIVDEKGVHNIDSIPMEDFPRNERVIKLDWQDLNLNKLSPQANLYLVPDTFINSFSKQTEYHPKFDIDKAIPVTIDYGK